MTTDKKIAEDIVNNALRMAKDKGFNLSKKKHYSEDDVAMLGFHSSMTFLDIEDVKEFIKMLKEEDKELNLELKKIIIRFESNDLDDWDIGLGMLRKFQNGFLDLQIKRDKLAGDKLI